MTSPAPKTDLLIVADQADEDAHAWFPADRVKHGKDYRALEGIRFRNVYITNRAIEDGSYVLFQILYRAAVMMNGSVLHVSDYREY